MILLRHRYTRRKTEKDKTDKRIRMNEDEERGREIEKPSRITSFTSSFTGQSGTNVNINRNLPIYLLGD